MGESPSKRKRKNLFLRKKSPVKREGSAQKRKKEKGGKQVHSKRECDKRGSNLVVQLAFQEGRRTPRMTNGERKPKLELRKPDSKSGGGEPPPKGNCSFTGRGGNRKKRKKKKTVTGVKKILFRRRGGVRNQGRS